MAKGKPPESKKSKRRRRRKKYASPEQIRAQLEGISAAQERFRRAAKRQLKSKDDLPENVEAVIIESREKSERALRNVLKSIRSIKDADAFD